MLLGQDVLFPYSRRRVWDSENATVHENKHFVKTHDMPRDTSPYPWDTEKWDMVIDECMSPNRTLTLSFPPRVRKIGSMINVRTLVIFRKMLFSPQSQSGRNLQWKLLKVHSMMSCYLFWTPVIHISENKGEFRKTPFHFSESTVEGKIARNGAGWTAKLSLYPSYGECFTVRAPFLAIHEDVSG